MLSTTSLRSIFQTCSISSRSSFLWVITDDPLSSDQSEQLRAEKLWSVQAVSPALSPQCRDVDSQHLSRFFERHRLLEHDLDMPALHLLERVTVIELVG